MASAPSPCNSDKQLLQRTEHLGEMDVPRPPPCSLSCTRVRVPQIGSLETCKDTDCTRSIQTLTAAGSVHHVWSVLQCKVWIAYQLAFSEVLIVAVETVLIVRSKWPPPMFDQQCPCSRLHAVYAMFNRSRAIAALVLILFVGEISAMCTILAITVPQIEFTTTCLITRTPKLFSSYWSVSSHSDVSM